MPSFILFSALPLPPGNCGGALRDMTAATARAKSSFMSTAADPLTALLQLIPRPLLWRYAFFRKALTESEARESTDE